MKSVNVHSQHRERLRKRYIREGIDNFACHEILELLLHYPIKQSDTNVTAHNLINRIGSFNGVFSASINELCEVDGIGEESATFLKLIYGVSELYFQEKKEKATLFKEVKAAAGYCVEQYRNVTELAYSVMLFDISDRLLGFERLSVTSFHESGDFVKELGKYIFGYNANRYIIVRNTLDGNITPSDREMEVCSGISKFFCVFNRIMSEYLIVSDDRYMPVCKYSRDYINKLEERKRAKRIWEHINEANDGDVFLITEEPEDFFES